MLVMSIPEGAWHKWTIGDPWTETQTLLPIATAACIFCSDGRVINVYTRQTTNKQKQQHVWMWICARFSMGLYTMHRGNRQQNSTCRHAGDSIDIPPIGPYLNHSLLHHLRCLKRLAAKTNIHYNQLLLAHSENYSSVAVITACPDTLHHRGKLRSSAQGYLLLV